MNASIMMAGALLSLGTLPAAAEPDFFMSGNVSAEYRYYFESGQHQGQDYRSNVSLSAEPELVWEWDQGDGSVVFKPFARWDQQDDERTHGDIRELLWVQVGDGWESRIGLGKVFWGVTEFNHLVDIINQTDSVESFDGEEKLGQAMVSLSLMRDWGTLDTYLLPGFRERTFAGGEGRLRSAQPVIEDKAKYESGAKQQHLDVALRWSHSIDLFDLGGYWFHGTNREPQLLANPDGSDSWIPFYDQIDQLGLDIQATLDAWLLKFEGIVQENSLERFTAIQSGFEYTYYGIGDSAADLGILLEYGWDERGKSASSSMQNDLTLGTRLTLNDTDSTEFLVGLGYDLDFHSKSLVLEGNLRVGDSTKLVLDGQFFSVNSQRDSAWQLKDDSYLQLTLEHYF